MTGADVFFEMVDPSKDEPEEVKYDDGRCRCAKPDGIWRLSIEEGSVGLIHKACGGALPDESLEMTVFMPEMEMLLSIESETCRCYHSCECSPSVVLTLPW